VRRAAVVVGLALLGCGSGERSFEAPMTLGGEEVSADVLNFGELVYMQRCRGCHGQHGEGDGPYGSAMDPRPADLTRGVYRHLEGERPSDAELERVITEGIDGTGMTAIDLEGEPLNAVIQYIKTLAPRTWRDDQRVQ